MLNIDTNQILNILSDSLTFCDNNTRDIYPLLISTRYLLPNSYHAVEGRRNYFPGSKEVGCATSEAMTGFARACFYAFDATNNVAWRNLGINILNAFVDYFFVDQIPISTNIWDSHWLCLAFGSTPTKGTQPNTNPPSSPFNYGNFDTVVNFTNGVGIIPSGSLVADVYKVYSVSSSLKYQNVYAPLLDGGIEYSVNYWVSNYSLEGQTFRVFPDGTRTTTNETIGTIRLTSNFTGQAKVMWSDYTGGTITSPTTPRQGQGLLEPYPMWHACKKSDGRTFLNTAFDTYWWGWEAFELAFKHTNDIKWKRAANSFKFTAQQAMRIENVSFYYKKENSSFPFRYPGTQVFTTNNGTNPKPTLTSSRETVNDKKNYLKLIMGNPAAGSFPTLEVQNFIVQTEISPLVKVYAEAAISESTVIELKLSTSQDAFDFSQEYIAYWSLAGDSVARNITFNVNDFVRWGDNSVWYPTIADIPIFTFSGGNASITFSRIQEQISTTNPVVLHVTFSKGTGFAGCGLNNSDFDTTPPSIRYSLSGNVTMRLQDANNVYWTCTLPDTGGQWSRFESSWSNFSGTGTPANGRIKECVFEVVSGVATLKIHYLGKTRNYVPETIPIPSRVFKGSIVSKVRVGHTFWVGDFRPLGNSLDKIPYTPGLVPFTRNTIRVPAPGGGFETIEDSWGDGMIYMGYLSPYHQYVWGDIESASNQISLLADSFSAYTRQSTSRIRGLPQQVFLAALWDAAAFVTFGEKLPPVVKRVMGFLFPFWFDKKTEVPSIGYKLNEFSWNGADPNTGWFPYTARVMEATARYVYENPSDIKAKSLLQQYFTFLKSDYDKRQSIRPLTDILPIIDPQSNYHEPHCAALIGRAAMWSNLAGISPKLTLDILEICHDYIISQQVTSGTMQGSFSLGQPIFTHAGTQYREYFSFWHGEIIEFFALLIKYKDFLNYPSLSEPGIFPSIEPTRIKNFKFSTKSNEKIPFSDGNRQVLKYRKSSQGVRLVIDYESITQNEVEIFLDFYEKHATSDLFELPTNIGVFNRFRVTTNSVPILYRITQKPDFKTRVSTKQRGIWDTTITIESFE